MIVLDKVIADHSTLCNIALNDSFIEKNKYDCIVDRIPNIKLRRLSEYEFKNGITKLLEFDTDKIQHEAYGKVLYVETEAVKVPAVYHLLCEIILNTNVKIRAKSFHSVIEKYYKVVSKYEITSDQFRAQVRLFLPYAKLEKLHKLCNEHYIDGSETIWEVEECFLYPELLREEVYSIVNSIYKSNQPELISFDVKLAKDLPGNLVKYFRIEVTVKNTTEIRTHHLFARMIDENKEKIITEFTRLPFRKERFFFEIILDLLKELGAEKITNFCPKCYFTRRDMLIFDDISMDGYKSWDYQVPVSYRWLDTAIKLLAKLHASSIILEEKLGAKLGKTVSLDEEYPDDVREAAFVSKEEYREIEQCNKRSIYGYLPSKFPDVPKRINMNKLREKVKVAYDRIFDIVKKSEKIRNVLSHGDMWGGNIMYKEDKTTDVSSAYLIGFQLIRYCPPSLDLMFLLYSNTDRATRVKYMKELIRLYYKELDHILGSYDIDLGKIFTFDQLMESCNDVEPSIICISLMYGPFLLFPPQQRRYIQNDRERANIMYKEDKITEVSSAYLIDFQLIRYCPPSLDLMFLLYTNTDRATRVEHLNELIRLYYKELEHILGSYDIDLENIFTFDQLMESVKEVEPSIICMSLMYGSFLLLPPQQKKDIQNDKERDTKFSKVDKSPELEKAWDYEPFKIRMQGLIEDIIRIYDDDT